MEVRFHKRFKKDYKKLAEKDRRQFQRRLGVFLRDPFEPTLNNHVLKGKYRGYRSINISGDIRALYEPLKKDVALFVTVGSHSHLYF